MTQTGSNGCDLSRDYRGTLWPSAQMMGIFLQDYKRFTGDWSAIEKLPRRAVIGTSGAANVEC